MGRRFLNLAAQISNLTILTTAINHTTEVHLAPSFGFVAGALGLDPELAAAAYLQQSITALVYSCQRLLPLGQSRAHQILWNLKPATVAAVRRRSSQCFTPLLDIASSRHPTLRTRLFIS
jgi:urease accessory protein